MRRWLLAQLLLTVRHQHRSDVTPSNGTNGETVVWDSTPAGGSDPVKRPLMRRKEEEEEETRHCPKHISSSATRECFIKMSQNTLDKDDQSSTNKKNNSLPISRVRLIMKSSPDVSSINQDALFLTTKATELFVQHLAVTSFNNGPGKDTNSLCYTDLANAAEETETFHFLTEMQTPSP
ncbi:chromatin accessibility complex protein 1 isoform X2 [Clinocottus analis]|uniref:chromatin accessibility complex protein 1 isoform X2 n=1 Tax=Clinocottus analis TaxID=304258 RepID=UPI0035C0EDB8